MKRWRRLFAIVLLAGVVLHLGDWPYIDEMLGTAGPVDQAVGTHVAAVRPPSGTHAGHKLNPDIGYEMLLLMHAAPAPWPSADEAVADKAQPAVRRLLGSALPSRIDRPPSVAARA